MDKDKKYAIVVDDPVFAGYILYRCPKCNEVIMRRKIGEVLKDEAIYCYRCGNYLNLK